MLNKTIDKINHALKNKSINVQLNAYKYQQLCKYFKLYENLEFCYPVLIDKNPRKLFSQNTVVYLVNQIVNDNNIIEKAIYYNKK